MNSKVLVTGSTGMLGSVLLPHLEAAGHAVFRHGRSSSGGLAADLCKPADSDRLVQSVQPQVVINLIGLTSVEGCEENLHRAYTVNTLTVENLVSSLVRYAPDCYLVHISTDHLYDGVGEHREADVTITNNYAMTKYAGELAALRARSSVLRTNFIGRSNIANRQSLTDWIYQSLSREESIEVLDDVYFSPLAMKTLSNMIELVVRRQPVGVFNLGSHGGMSKADLDFEFAVKAGLQVGTMTRILSSQARFLRAYRPKNMRMDVSRFERVLGVQLPSLAEEIESVARQYVE